MADNTTELEVLDQIVDVLGGTSGQYETVVPTLQQILALLGGEGIPNAVDTWLDEHPEATTTVQDGSITGVKIADNTIPDAKLAQTGGVLSRVAALESEFNQSTVVDIPWEHGNIYMTSEQIYYNGTEANARIRTPLGYVLPLGTGDTIEIPADGTVALYVGWEVSNGYQFVGWIRSTFTAEVDSNYYVLARFYPQVEFDDVDELSQHITVTRYSNIKDEVDNLDARVTALEDDDTSMIVPRYYESNLSSAIATAQAAMTSASINGETFIFLSDIHWEANEKHSPSLVKAVTSVLPIENTVFGGDTFNGGTQAAMVEIMNDVRQRFVKASPHFLSVYGNHDGNQLDGGVAFTNDEFYTYMQKQADYYVSYEAPCYYYMDNEATKTRYIVLDSRTTTPSTASAQLAWLQSITASAGAGWHFIVFCHVIFYPDSSGSWTDPTTWVMSQFMTDVLAALDAVNTGGSSKVEAIFGGHCHRDYNTQTQGGIPIVLIDCDTKQTVSGNPQTAGTVNEQCLDIVTVNYSAETITCARIGRGTSRTISY